MVTGSERGRGNNGCCKNMKSVTACRGMELFEGGSV